MPEFLMCPPDHYNIDYEINAWMDIHKETDKKLSEEQWVKFYDNLIDTGSTVQLIKPHPHFPDMVFTANAGLVKGDVVILSNNKHKERQGESKLFKKWFLDNGYRVIELPKNIYFEGAGDALFFNDVLFMGYGFRTSKEAHKIIANVFNVDYVSCELVNPRFYHLDTCFFPMEGRLVYYRKAFSEDSADKIIQTVVEQSLFNQLDIDILNVNDVCASQFICNSVEANNSIITPSEEGYALFGEQHNVSHCDMSEFMKAGGASKCLTLRL